jgi:hypothetical protein
MEYGSKFYGVLINSITNFKAANVIVCKEFKSMTLDENNPSADGGV